MADDLGVLMALRVQGIASDERLADAAGISRDVAAERLSALATGGTVEQRNGRVPGFTLTATGAEQLDGLLASEALRDSDDLKEAYDRFLQLNDRVLRTCSAWQVRRDGGIEEPNDHSDASYDDEVITRLTGLHDRARVFLEKVAVCSVRFAPYGARLDRCIERLLSGDTTAFTTALAESYHTVWFELHQDLLLTLGLSREE